MLPTLAIVGALNQSRYDTTNTFTKFQFGVQNFWDANVFLRLSQPLYHQEYWTQLDLTDNQIAQAEAEYAAEQQNLLLRVAKAYFAVLAAEDNAGFTNAETHALEQQLRQIKQFYAAGTVANTDLREAQSAFDQASAAEIAAQRGLHVAQAALQEIIGQVDFKLNPLREELPLDPPSPANIQEWGAMAQQNNLAILAAENRAEVARKSIDLQSFGHLPSLDMVGNVGITDTDRPAGLVSNSQSFGVQLNMPLFQGGSVSSRVRQARSQFEAAKESVDRERRAVRRQVQDAYDGILFSIGQVRALKTVVESSRAAVDATEASLRVGTRTMVDVTTMQRNFSKAQRDDAQARYEYVINGLLLKQGAGSLGKEDLAAVNSWLH